jgi:hypothetical protein
MKTIIIMIEAFISNNNFTVLSHNITNKQQQNIRNCIQNSKNMIKHINKWKYINMNPSAPQIHGTIKVHKPEKSLRPVVNWTDSPEYKLAKHLNTILNNVLQLPYAFNVKTQTF